MATRSDVARAAGVSVRTVSNVLAGFSSVSPKTRERVLNAASELGYQSSELARSLKVGRSGIIGLMLPHLEMPYFAELTSEFMEASHSRGLSLLVDQTNGDLERERSLIARVAKGGILDGLIFSPLMSGPDDIASLTGGGPVVLLGEVEFSGIDRVLIDNVGAAEQAVSHLIERGARRIGVIGYSIHDVGAGPQRMIGYKQALKKAGIPFDPVLAPETRPGHQPIDAIDAAERLMALRDLPDAVFVFTDTMAFAASGVFARHGLRVPDDLLLMGFDGNQLSDYGKPTLSTISPDKAWIANRALDLILSRLDGSDALPQIHSGPYELIVRESTTR